MRLGADDDAHRELLSAVIVIIDAVGGLVDEDVALTEIIRQPARLLHGNDHLVDHGLRRMTGHLSQRRGTDDAVGLQTDLTLKRFHQFDQFRRVFRSLLIGGKRCGMLRPKRF
ncbi:hypothetical protein D3C72_220440 [compost metagenome]